MSAFSDAIDIIFTDGNVAEDAIWRVGGIGPGFPVRIIRKSPDNVVNFGGSRAVMPTVVIAVRASDVAAPSSGDTVEINLDIFNIIAQPTRDGSGLVWGCEISERT